MAIYDVDAIRESELMEAETDSDSILDNMLEACDQMLSAIGESGGAHQKYLKMLSDKDKAAKEKIDNIDYIGSGTEAQNNLRRKYSNLRSEYADKAQKYTFGPGEDRRWTDTKPLPGAKSEYTASASDLVNKTNEKSKRKTLTKADAAFLRKGKEAFKKDFGGPGGEDPMVEKAKRQEEIRKKRAIKETCLTILSVLDEI